MDYKYKAPEKAKESVQEMILRLTGQDISLCPNCKTGRLVTVAQIERRPLSWTLHENNQYAKKDRSSSIALKSVDG